MKRPTTIICLAATAALVLPATAGAAEKEYGGKINDGGKIGIIANLTGGEATEVTQMTFKKFPAHCDNFQGGGLNAVIGATYDFTGVTVVDNKFVVDEDVSKRGNTPHLFFKGTFSHQDKQIDGKVQATFGPPDNCNSPKKGYSAKRGNPAPNPLKAKVARAFRVTN